MERSLAFTALLEMDPAFGQLDVRDGDKRITALVDAWRARPADSGGKIATFWDFARTWITVTA